MTIQIGIHDPNSARLNTFTHDGKLMGSVQIHCGEMSATIYTTPAKAQAIADAINTVDIDELFKAIEQAAPPAPE